MEPYPRASVRVNLEIVEVKVVGAEKGSNLGD
jgi:hypothetical protein